MIELDFSANQVLLFLFLIGAVLIFLGTVSGGGFFLGILLLGVALYLLYAVLRRLDQRLVHGKRRRD